jgi:hypothetical protein
MAFLTKVDPFGISSSTLAVKSTSDGNSGSVAEATDENGTIVAQESYGNRMSPSAEYALKKETAFDEIVLGGVSTYKTKRVVLTQLTINTSAGGEPTISASGEEIEASSDGTCPATYTIPEFTLGVCHHAKILFSAFSLSGTGCYLNSANYTAQCENGTAMIEGAVVAHGVYGAYLEATAEIISTSGTVPTVTPGTGWVVSSPLAETNPDADYPTYSITLRKPIALDS